MMMTMVMTGFRFPVIIPLFVMRKRADWKSGPSEPRKPDHDDDDGLTWLTFTNCLID